MQVYRAFGLTIGSDLPLPELPVSDGTPDVWIRRAPVGDWQGEATVKYGERFRIRGHEWMIRFKLLPFAARIRNGNSIEFEANPGQDAIAALHILGSCTGGLLFQRGLIPLHGNTTTSDKGVAMFVGRIGAGKSATTMAMLRRGHHLVADDISAVSIEVGKRAAGPSVLPGFPRLKLWRASLDHFGCDPAEFQHLRPGLDKFHVPVSGHFCDEPQPLRAIYILQPGDTPEVRIRTLSGLAKLEALRPHLYKLRFPDAIQIFPPLMGKLCRLVDLVRVSIVERPREGNSIDAVADAIETDLASDYRSRNAASVA
ncbi:MAG TPA: hypothetical protein VHA14_02135 [Bryobacteraceae bacterium]|nr:hypothetical protein [Bryobacteraceae bacterium]